MLTTVFTPLVTPYLKKSLEMKIFSKMKKYLSKSDAHLGDSKVTNLELAFGS